MHSPIYNYAYAHSRARSAGLTLEFFLLNSLAILFPPSPTRASTRELRKNTALIQAVQAELVKILREDSARIERGVYPLKVLQPESLLEHFGRYPTLVKDAVSIYLRRLKGRTTEFDSKAKTLLAGLPRYYRRNFHFQTNGYLSETSAQMYEHQVELLFKGAADPMRRLIIEPLRNHFKSRDGKELRFLEIGAGTGRATRFVRLAFPEAEIVAVDLSNPYLDVAEKKLADLEGITLEQADGAHLPYKNAEFDAVYSVFLFHELPLTARREILAESLRVLKPGGFLGLVDSIQTGDNEILDPILPEFPQEFHEPYYRNYIAHPMEGLLEEAGLQEVRKEYGFTSKLCWGKKKASTKGKAKRPSKKPRSSG